MHCLGLCWKWDRKPNSNGYGRITVDGKRIYIHRYYYELMYGKIPKGLQIDHLCRNRMCYNPSHLEAVTNKVNSLRGISLNAQNSRKTHCIHGHELKGNNLILKSNGNRNCRTCKNRIDREGYKRRKNNAV